MRRKNIHKFLYYVISLSKVVFRVRVLFVFYVMLALVGCGDTVGTTGTANKTLPSSGHWPGSLAVTFAPSISYEKALRFVTEIGLQPALDCAIDVRMVTPDSGKGIVPQQLWEPVGQRENYLSKHQLLIDTATPPADWSNRLNTSPEVLSVGFLEPSNYTCKRVVYGTPSGKTAIPLPASVAEQYVRITFNAQENYDNALYAISNEGLRLADPCYDQARLKGQNPPWHPMGQEKTFAATHTLVVATSKKITSNLWQEHLKAIPAILSIDGNINC
jgi:hypothetical protein